MSAQRAHLSDPLFWASHSKDSHSLQTCTATKTHHCINNWTASLKVQLRDKHWVGVLKQQDHHFFQCADSSCRPPGAPDGRWDWGSAFCPGASLFYSAFRPAGRAAAPPAGGTGCHPGLWWSPLTCRPAFDRNCRSVLFKYNYSAICIPHRIQCLAPSCVPGVQPRACWGMTRWQSLM